MHPALPASVASKRFFTLWLCFLARILQATSLIFWVACSWSLSLAICGRLGSCERPLGGSPILEKMASCVTETLCHRFLDLACENRIAKGYSLLTSWLYRQSSGFRARRRCWSLRIWTKVRASSSGTSHVVCRTYTLRDMWRQQRVLSCLSLELPIFVLQKSIHFSPSIDYGNLVYEKALCGIFFAWHLLDLSSEQKSHYPHEAETPDVLSTLKIGRCYYSWHGDAASIKDLAESPLW